MSNDLSKELQFVHMLEKQAGLDKLPKLEERWELPEPVGIHELGVMQDVKPRLEGVHYDDLAGVARDYELITMGPVYVFAGIPFAIPDQIASELNRTFNWITLNTGKPFFAGIHEWNNLIEGVSKADWGVFMKNLLSVFAINRETKTYWEIACKTVTFIPQGTMTPLVLRLFMPSGTAASYRVGFDPVKHEMHFIKDPPQGDVLQRGTAALTM